MVTKSKAGKKTSRVKVGKLKLNKETVKDLTVKNAKQIRAGAACAESRSKCHSDNPPTGLICVC